jgi:hypothetical protein
VLPASSLQVTVFDLNDRRLHPLRRFGVATAAKLGASASGCDVALELSGAGEALGQAIRSTRRGRLGLGRSQGEIQCWMIIGWYLIIFNIYIYVLIN